MDDKKWIENIAKYRVLSWIIVIVLLGCSLKIASAINLLLYGEANINPWSTHWLTLAIYFGGYSLWSSTVAANVAGKIFIELIKRLFKRLIRTKKLDNEDVEGVGKELLNEETQNKLLSDIRKGSKSFVKAGLFFGFILGLKHIITIEPSLGFKGLAIFMAYGFSWGYLWYKLAWIGFVPLPSGEEA